MKQELNIIRKAQQSDASRLGEILIFTKRVTYRPIFQNDAVSFREMQVLDIALEYRDNAERLKDVYVFDDGIVKGMMSWNCFGSEHEWELRELYVDSFFQGQGVGKKLLNYFIEHAKNQGITSVYLWVLEKNQSAREFYEKQGFYFEGTKMLEEGTTEYICLYKRKIVEV